MTKQLIYRHTKVTCIQLIFHRTCSFCVINIFTCSKCLEKHIYCKSSFVCFFYCLLCDRLWWHYCRLHAQLVKISARVLLVDEASAIRTEQEARSSSPTENLHKDSSDADCRFLFDFLHPILLLIEYHIKNDSEAKHCTNDVQGVGLHHQRFTFSAWLWHSAIFVLFVDGTTTSVRFHATSPVPSARSRVSERTSSKDANGKQENFFEGCQWWLREFAEMVQQREGL